MPNGLKYFDLVLALVGLGLSTYAFGKVLNLTGRPKRLWLGFLCFTVGSTLGNLSWLITSVPAITPLTSYFVRGSLLVIAFILIVANAPITGSGHK
jgi:hypothetical protein